MPFFLKHYYEKATGWLYGHDIGSPDATAETTSGQNGASRRPHL